MRNRKEEIKKKGFSMAEKDLDTYAPIDFSKIRIGVKSLDDAVLNLGTYKKVNSRLADKTYVARALANNDVAALRDISNFFFETSGIYNRLCKYLAFLYRYDWYVTPTISSDESSNKTKMVTDFYKILDFLDNSNLKKLFGDIALSVVKNGCFYAYKINNPEKIVIQELPVSYCRSRFYQGTQPVVELNLKYFDDAFTNAEYRKKILKLFPYEIQKAYVLYHEGKLKGEYPGDEAGWFVLDPTLTIKFSLNGSDFPILSNAIPSIIDLDEAQDLDRKKTMQKLLKIIIQKLPVDKNGDLIFDVDEAKDLHNNAVQMLKRAVGVDVLTTFADTEVANMSDSNTTTSIDDLQKVERAIYNQTGISQNVFNTDGNLSLEKSILNDEATMRNLILQFQDFLNSCIKQFNRNKKKYSFRVYILDTTIYNYQDLASKYKEQVQIGYSKMLPQVALGHSQSSILASAIFENQILDLTTIMIPPLMSSTMSSQDVLNKTKDSSNNTGRPEKSDSEKSEKTIANKESMN